MQNPRTFTPEQRRAALMVVEAVAEAIQAAGADGIPSGHLYSVLMGSLSLTAYTNLIETMQRTGLVSVKDHVIRWTGPIREQEV